MCISQDMNFCVASFIYDTWLVMKSWKRAFLNLHLRFRSQYNSIVRVKFDWDTFDNSLNGVGSSICKANDSDNYKPQIWEIKFLNIRFFWEISKFLPFQHDCITYRQFSRRLNKHSVVINRHVKLYSLLVWTADSSFVLVSAFQDYIPAEAKRL